jgi:NRAMP (natural resistance-associated macrophage protein)-like metal ion transporter
MIVWLKKTFKILGPGFTTGASDDDPSGIATYSQTGAQFGYSQLWMVLFVFPFMAIIQEMCGRIGLVTGRGLASINQKHYGRPMLYLAVLLLFIANVVNIGADLGAMASSAQLILHLPFALWLIIITALTICLEVFVSFHVYSQYLKYLAFSLFAYIITAFIVCQDWQQVFTATLIPHMHMTSDYLMNLVAVLGTTISPYLFFWQASEEVESEVDSHQLKEMGNGTPQIRKKDIWEMQLDTFAGMFFANLVMFFIILTTASTLHMHHIQNIETATQAAEAIRPFAGAFTSLLFAAGIIGTGLLGVPVLAGSAAYAISEMLHWKEGLSLKFQQATGFYSIISLATFIGLLINFIQIPPFKMLYYTAVLNGICAPPLMFIIMRIGNNKNIMGRYVNSLLSNWIGWGITILMSLAAIALLYQIFFMQNT